MTTNNSIDTGNGTTAQVLQANTGAAPTYSTATYPSTTTINRILYSSANNTVGQITTANQGVLTTGTTGIPSVTAIATDGQLIIGSTAGAPAAATLTAGANITITNASNSITIAASGGSSSGGLKSFQIFTSGSAATYTKPGGITSILVECLGGGGGGGGVTTGGGDTSAGGGGAGGGYCRKWIASAAGTYTYTVGAAGTAGASTGGNGGAGGATTFSTLSAGGGGGGTGALANASASFAAGGTPGSTSGGDFNVNGSPGLPGIGLLTVAWSGTGGSSIYGGGGLAVGSNSVSDVAGNNGGNYGSGGSGAYSLAGGASAAGGTGSAGLIVVWEFS